MSERKEDRIDPREKRLVSEVGRQAKRRLRSIHHPTRGLWFGLGMMGLVGWSVVVPTLAGAILGVWLDEHYPASFSWTLTLLMSGLIVGCWNAWRWVIEEDKAMNTEKSEDPHV